MENKLHGALGLAARARKIAVGETAVELICSKKAKLVFLANNSSERTHSRILHICNSCGVPCIDRYSSEEISEAIGQWNRMTVAIMDERMAKAILNCLK